MVEFSHRDKTVRLRVVYYGPAIGGKTTNLLALHGRALAGRRGEMLSINSRQDRTILFDLLPLAAAGFRGFDVRVQLVAVPGQALYAATRRVALKGADAVVFVGNSARDRFHETQLSYQEMAQNLLANQIDPSTVPLVVQYNKRDLPEVTEIEVLERSVNVRHVPFFPAVAVRGEGVLETFTAILTLAMRELSSRYGMAEMGPGLTVEQWAETTVLGLFGATSIAGPPAGEAAAGRRTLQVPLPEDIPRSAAATDPRVDKALLDSCARASAELGVALAEARAEHEQARDRLADFEDAAAAAQCILSGREPEAALRSLAARMAAAARCDHASLLVRGEGGLHPAAAYGFEPGNPPPDPLGLAASASPSLHAALLQEAEPLVHRFEDGGEIGRALPPAFAAAATVPARTPRGLQALAVLYFRPDAVLPDPATLLHLERLARVVAAPLEAAGLIEQAIGRERVQRGAAAATASLACQPRVARSLEALRDGLAAVRSRPDAPGWLREDLARLAPALAVPLETGRAVLAMSRGRLEPESVALDDLLDGLDVEGLELRLGPDADTVACEPPLLRAALTALAENARAAAGGAGAVWLTAEAEGGGLRLEIRAAATGAAAPAPPRRAVERGAGLAMAERVAELHGGRLEVADGGRAVLHLPSR